MAHRLFFEGENKPKSVIRRAESVFDWESEALLRLDVARYAFG